jgi:hypothetical protein
MLRLFFLRVTAVRGAGFPMNAGVCLDVPSSSTCSRTSKYPYLRVLCLEKSSTYHVFSVTSMPTSDGVASGRCSRIYIRWMREFLSGERRYRRSRSFSFHEVRRRDRRKHGLKPRRTANSVR